MSSEPPELRAADADRERVAQWLRAAHAEGRLDVDEVEERLSAAYAARTFGDLEPLTADLGPPPAEPVARPSRASRVASKHLREWAGTAVILNAIWIITCLAAGELLFYWPMFPVGIWGAVIVAELFFGLGDDEPRRDRGRGLPEPPQPPEPPRLP